MSDMLRQLWHRIEALFRRETMEQELDAELDAHLELAIEENVERGMTPGEARRQALMRFGGAAQAREEHRKARSLPVVEVVGKDLRYAARQLLKNPGFTAAAVLTLALGIAVNATMFSMVSAFLLRKPPGTDPERVAVVSAVNPTGTFHADTTPVSAPNYLAWRQANDVFAEMAAADEDRTVSLTAPRETAAGVPARTGEAEALRAAAVSPNYFSVLGTGAQMGRTFEAGEDEPGRDRVVILSWDLWEKRFGADASLIGRTVRLNRENYTVIGVMPASFRLLGFTPQVWMPLVLSTADQTAAARSERNLHIFARMKPGVTLEQARAECVALGRRSAENFPETEKGWGVAVRTLPDFLIYDFEIRGPLGILMTTVGFVLMIACANVAGLLLARAGSRRKEMAIRIAMGASRVRVMLQLLTEGLLIALLGGGTGLLLAYWGVGFVRSSLSFNEAISAVELKLDWNVVLFGLGASLMCAVLCGLAPALNASRTDINANLKDESRAASASQGQSRLRTVMVTGEIALAMFLLIGAGLLFRGIYRIEHQNLGFQPEHLLTAEVTLDPAKYTDAGERTQFVRNVLARLEHLPSAERAAVASELPASGPTRASFGIQGQPDLPPGQNRSALNVVVTPEYFETAGIALLRGRTFTERDNGNAARVVVVNQEFVHRYLQDQEGLGKQIHLKVSGGAPGWSEIVGVVSNVKPYSEESRDDAEIYEPLFQRPPASFALMIRTTAEPGSVAPALREAVAQEDAELPLSRVMSMRALIDRQKGGDPFFAEILSTFALLALLLASIGIYGLIAYSVGQRKHEIGIRVALGASSENVVRMVLWQGLKMAGIGTAVGLALAAPLPKIFASMLHGLQLREPWLYVVVPGAIFVVALLAAYIPARRATRVDPMVALHQA